LQSSHGLAGCAALWGFSRQGGPAMTGRQVGRSRIGRSACLQLSMPCQARAVARRPHSRGQPGPAESPAIARSARLTCLWTGGTANAPSSPIARSSARTWQRLACSASTRAAADSVASELPCLGNLRFTVSTLTRGRLRDAELPAAMVYRLMYVSRKCWALARQPWKAQPQAGRCACGEHAPEGQWRLRTSCFHRMAPHQLSSATLA